eukprot:252785-Hanusia_phi.AAC.1
MPPRPPVLTSPRPTSSTSSSKVKGKDGIGGGEGEAGGAGGFQEEGGEGGDDDETSVLVSLGLEAEQGAT